MDTLFAEALKVVPVGQALVLILLVWIGNSVRSVRDSATKLEQGLGRMQEWQKGHEKLDDDRHKTVMDTFEKFTAR